MAQEEWVLGNKGVSSEGPLGEGWGFTWFIVVVFIFTTKVVVIVTSEINKLLYVRFIYLFMGVIC